MIRLHCPAQNYAWGRLGRHDSEVANLVGAAGRPVDESQPYAELWMGSHPSGPAMLANAPDTTLSDWLAAHAPALGQTVRDRFGDTLPFLFKVLSVQTALSIQSHPDKELAEKLHAERPHDYKDDNHKPEMAIAITDFEALKAVLKEAFSALMTCSPDKVHAAVQALEARLQRKADSGHQLTNKEALVLRLHDQYPHDVGVLSAFFLNLVELAPDEAIYLAANVPHAYLSGQLMECMATSDNVVRAGLTPKLRDTEVLCESLTYHQGPPDVLRGTPLGRYTTVYQPPFEEFEVRRMELPGHAESIVSANQGPTVMLVQQGSASAQAVCPQAYPHAEAMTQLSRGDVFFLPSDTALQLTNTESDPLPQVRAML
ncbi:hypothetical protein WJX73_004588 [Symbiochloris irregularis]|uniref:mannose-6-phosphate isomerase n=1 Tax=Symbiochloris irregularis TaxID=706552 RepID=A0AAW1PDM5_9CHLO